MTRYAWHHEGGEYVVWLTAALTGHRIERHTACSTKAEAIRLCHNLNGGE